MKNLIRPLLLVILSGLLGYSFGYYFGYENCDKEYKTGNTLRSAEEIKVELKNQEIESITRFLDGTASISKINEGSIFKKKQVNYFSGSIHNSALIATARDIKIVVDYFSKTGAKVGSQEIVLYDYIKPGESITFKKKVNISENLEKFEFRITNAKAE